MARPKVEELQKHTLNLRSGDVNAIAELFPGKSPTVVIRKLISKFVDNCYEGSRHKTPIATEISMESE